jgi:hypothetical protein
VIRPEGTESSEWAPLSSPPAFLCTAPRGHTAVVSDSPSDSRAVDRARLEERSQKALEAFRKARQSGSAQAAAARDEWMAAELALGHSDAVVAAKLAAEMLMRPPTGEAPAHE